MQQILLNDRLTKLLEYVMIELTLNIFKERFTMGIRPNKSIGWGITAKGSELNEQVVENILEQVDNKDFSYKGLIDYLETYNLMEEHRGYGYITKEKFTKLDKSRTLFNYVEIIPEEYDSSEDFNDQNWTIIFYPMVLSSLAFQDDSGIEFKQGSSPFVYAEIEKFFPKSMEEFSTVSYVFEQPPFPSEYSVIHKNKAKSSNVFKKVDAKYRPDVQRCLRAEPEDDVSIFAQVMGFKNVDGVKETYMLAPDEAVFSFAQYSGVFKDSSKSFELKPTVAYYWN